MSDLRSLIVLGVRLFSVPSLGKLFTPIRQAGKKSLMRLPEQTDRAGSVGKRHGRGWKPRPVDIVDWQELP